MEAPAGATSLRRGLMALEALAAEETVREGGLGVVEMARRLGVDKSQASRTLKTLAEHGLVERDPASRTYALGPRLFAYAAVIGRRRLLQLAPPVLRRLTADLGERSHLTVLEGGEVLTLLSESPSHNVQAAGWVGRSVPAVTTASGRALLLDHGREGLAPLVRDAEPGTLDQLAERLAKARERGWVMVRDEFERGLVAVAAPVRGFDGRIVAALNVSGPTFRFGTRAQAAGAEVRDAAVELSRALGAAPREARSA